MHMLGFIVMSMVWVNAAWAGVEIIANGQKYDSLEAYKTFERVKSDNPASAQKAAVTLAGENKNKETFSVDGWQEKMVLEAKGQGIIVDPAKMKTVSVNKVDPQDLQAIKKLRILSIASGDKTSLLSQVQSWKQPDALLVRRIDRSHLEKAIRQAVNQSPSAKMIVSQDHTVKILSLNPSSSD